MAARDQDFNSFYDQEIKFRQALNYPPFSRMIQLKISGKDPKLTQIHALKLGDCCRALKTSNPSFYAAVEIMGPLESSLAKIARRYRWQILLKGKQTKALHHFVNQLLSENSAVFHYHRVRVVIDVDPLFLM